MMRRMSKEKYIAVAVGRHIDRARRLAISLGEVVSVPLAHGRPVIEAAFEDDGTTCKG